MSVEAMTDLIASRAAVTSPPDLPSDSSQFDSRLRKPAQIAMPSAGTPEALSFASMGRQVYLTFTGTTLGRVMC